MNAAYIALQPCNLDALLNLLCITGLLNPIQTLANRVDMIPRGSIYTTLMELGAKNHIEDGLLKPNSIMVRLMDKILHYP